MTKAELIEAIAKASGQHANVVGKVLDAQATVVADTLADGEEITLPGVMRLKTKVRSARKGRNPQTGAEIDIPAKTVIDAKPPKALSDRIA